LLYISTDYVFSGCKGFYNESDELFPQNKYAWSKLGGECSCILYENSLILRMSMMEKPFPHKKAFSDSIRSNVWHEEAIEILYSLIESDAKGIYNVGGERKSVYDFVSTDLKDIEKDTIENYSERIPRDISLNVDKLRKTIRWKK
jgi:dTDP-4-dehydrorhamnose reductase